MIGRLISIDALFSRIVEDNDLESVPHNSMINWTKAALRQIGAYAQFESVCCSLSVVDYKATQPADFYRVDEGKFFLPYKLSGDGLVFKEREARYDFHYLRFPTDLEGELLIPENDSYQDAIKWYMFSMPALNKFLQLHHKDLTVSYCDDRWQQKKMEARAEANMGGIHQLQQAENDRRNLKQNMNPIRNGFAGMGRITPRATTRTR